MKTNGYAKIGNRIRRDLDGALSRLRQLGGVVMMWTGPYVGELTVRRRVGQVMPKQAGTSVWPHVSCCGRANRCTRRWTG